MSIIKNLAGFNLPFALLSLTASANSTLNSSATAVKRAEFCPLSPVLLAMLTVISNTGQPLPQISRASISAHVHTE